MCPLNVATLSPTFLSFRFRRLLFTPCKCSGSMGKVHQDCLVSWLEVTRGDGEFIKARGSWQLVVPYPNSVVSYLLLYLSFSLMLLFEIFFYFYQSYVLFYRVQAVVKSASINSVSNPSTPRTHPKDSTFMRSPLDYRAGSWQNGCH
jgi:RING-variant domain